MFGLISTEVLHSVIWEESVRTGGWNIADSLMTDVIKPDNFKNFVKKIPSPDKWRVFREHFKSR